MQRRLEPSGRWVGGHNQANRYVQIESSIPTPEDGFADLFTLFITIHRWARSQTYSSKPGRIAPSNLRPQNRICQILRHTMPYFAENLKASRIVSSPEGIRMARRLIRNQLPPRGLRVRVPCPPLLVSIRTDTQVVAFLGKA